MGNIIMCLVLAVVSGYGWAYGAPPIATGIGCIAALGITVGEVRKLQRAQRKEVKHG